MGGECNMLQRNEKSKIAVRNCEGKRLLEYLGIDEKTVLKCVLERMWIVSG
jgi:hypothetical protein